MTTTTATTPRTTVRTIVRRFDAWTLDVMNAPAGPGTRRRA